MENNIKLRERTYSRNALLNGILSPKTNKVKGLHNTFEMEDNDLSNGQIEKENIKQNSRINRIKGCCNNLIEQDQMPCSCSQPQDAIHLDEMKPVMNESENSNLEHTQSSQHLYLSNSVNNPKTVFDSNFASTQQTHDISDYSPPIVEENIATTISHFDGKLSEEEQHKNCVQFGNDSGNANYMKSNFNGNVNCTELKRNLHSDLNPFAEIFNYTKIHKNTIDLVPTRDVKNINSRLHTRSDNLSNNCLQESKQTNPCDRMLKSNWNESMACDKKNNFTETVHIVESTNCPNLCSIGNDFEERSQEKIISSSEEVQTYEGDVGNIEQSTNLAEMQETNISNNNQTPSYKGNTHTMTECTDKKKRKTSVLYGYYPQPSYFNKQESFTTQCNVINIPVNATRNIPLNLQNNVTRNTEHITPWNRGNPPHWNQGPHRIVNQSQIMLWNQIQAMSLKQAYNISLNQRHDLYQNHAQAVPCNRTHGIPQNQMHMPWMPYNHGNDPYSNQLKSLPWNQTHGIPLHQAHTIPWNQIQTIWNQGHQPYLNLSQTVPWSQAHAIPLKQGHSVPWNRESQSQYEKPLLIESDIEINSEVPHIDCDGVNEQVNNYSTRYTSIIGVEEAYAIIMANTKFFVRKLSWHCITSNKESILTCHLCNNVEINLDTHITSTNHLALIKDRNKVFLSEFRGLVHEFPVGHIDLYHCVNCDCYIYTMWNVKSHCDSPNHLAALDIYNEDLKLHQEKAVKLVRDSTGEVNALPPQPSVLPPPVNKENGHEYKVIYKIFTSPFEINYNDKTSTTFGKEIKVVSNRNIEVLDNSQELTEEKDHKAERNQISFNSMDDKINPTTSDIDKLNNFIDCKDMVDPSPLELLGSSSDVVETVDYIHKHEEISNYPNVIKEKKNDQVLIKQQNLKEMLEQNFSNLCDTKIETNDLEKFDMNVVKSKGTNKGKIKSKFVDTGVQTTFSLFKMLLSCDLKDVQVLKDIPNIRHKSSHMCLDDIYTATPNDTEKANESINLNEIKDHPSIIKIAGLTEEEIVHLKDLLSKLDINCHQVITEQGNFQHKNDLINNELPYNHVLKQSNTEEFSTLEKGNIRPVHNQLETECPNDIRETKEQTLLYHIGKKQFSLYPTRSKINTTVQVETDVILDLSQITLDEIFVNTFLKYSNHRSVVDFNCYSKFNLAISRKSYTDEPKTKFENIRKNSVDQYLLKNCNNDDTSKSENMKSDKDSEENCLGLNCENLTVVQLEDIVNSDNLKSKEISSAIRLESMVAIEKEQTVELLNNEDEVSNIELKRTISIGDLSASPYDPNIIKDFNYVSPLNLEIDMKNYKDGSRRKNENIKEQSDDQKSLKYYCNFDNTSESENMNSDKDTEKISLGENCENIAIVKLESIVNSDNLKSKEISPAIRLESTVAIEKEQTVELLNNEDEVSNIELKRTISIGDISASPYDPNIIKDFNCVSPLSLEIDMKNYKDGSRRKNENIEEQSDDQKSLKYYCNFDNTSESENMNSDKVTEKISLGENCENIAIVKLESIVNSDNLKSKEISPAIRLESMVAIEKEQTVELLNNEDEVSNIELKRTISIGDISASPYDPNIIKYFNCVSPLNLEIDMKNYKDGSRRKNENIEEQSDNKKSLKYYNNDDTSESENMKSDNDSEKHSFGVNCENLAVVKLESIVNSDNLKSKEISPAIRLESMVAIENEQTVELLNDEDELSNIELKRTMSNENTSASPCDPNTIQDFYCFSPLNLEIDMKNYKDGPRRKNENIEEQSDNQKSLKYYNNDDTLELENMKSDKVTEKISLGENCENIAVISPAIRLQSVVAIEKEQTVEIQNDEDKPSNIEMEETNDMDISIESVSATSCGSNIENNFKNDIHIEAIKVDETLNQNASVGEEMKNIQSEIETKGSKRPHEKSINENLNDIISFLRSSKKVNKAELEKCIQDVERQMERMNDVNNYELHELTYLITIINDLLTKLSKS